MLREAFKQIGEDVEATSDGVLKFAGLGQFRVKQVEREKYGVKEKIKRTIFLPARPKE